jgi:hypothetical protein
LNNGSENLHHFSALEIALRNFWFRWFHAVLRARLAGRLLFDAFPFF